MDPRIFSHTRYDEIVRRTCEELVELGRLKGGEYAGDTDRLANFRRNAADCDTSMELVWRIYAGKHWDAITQYVKDLQSGKERKRLESLAGRCDDLIVYLILFKCMIEEREAKPVGDPVETFNDGKPEVPLKSTLYDAMKDFNPAAPSFQRKEDAGNLVIETKAEIRERIAQNECSTSPKTWGPPAYRDGVGRVPATHGTVKPPAEGV